LLTSITKPAVDGKSLCDTRVAAPAAENIFPKPTAMQTVARTAVCPSALRVEFENYGAVILKIFPSCISV
jgi:hypothetical protein